MSNEIKAKYLATEAIKFMAKKNGITIAEVVAALNSFNEKAHKQFAELIAYGIEATA